MIAKGPSAPMGGGASELVNRVKAFQRSGNDAKELWGQYADQFLGGVRDPSRHDAASLEAYCNNHGVPEVSGGFGCGAPMIAKGPSAPMGKGAGASMGASMFAGAGADPEKADLAARVKAYQKSGPEAHEAWANHCGKWRDPNRHEKDFLADFCNTHGI